MTITIGEINTLITVLQNLPLAQLALVAAEGGGSLSDDAILAADVLGDISALLPPPYSAITVAATVLLELAAVAMVGAHISPDQDPIHDGQTTGTYIGR